MNKPSKWVRSTEEAINEYADAWLLMGADPSTDHMPAMMASRIKLRRILELMERRAEAMADAIEFGDLSILTVAKAAADAYRRDYPKEPT